MTALGAFGGVVFGVLVAMGPGGLDSRLYWRAPSSNVQGARPESEVATTNTVEADEGAVGAVRGEAEPSGDEGPTSTFIEDETTETIVTPGADSVSPEPTPTTDDTERVPGETFPPLPVDMQDRFRRAWFDGASEAEMIRRGTPPAQPGAARGTAGAAEAAPVEVAEETTEPEGTTETVVTETSGEVEQVQVTEQGAQPSEALPEGAAEPLVPEVGPTGAPAVAPETYAQEYGYAGENVIADNYVGENQAALDELVTVPRGALMPREYLGTDPRYDPFVHDARLNEERQTGATTGGAWTGGAWTGGATTGGAWTGGAWTGGATTGGAWTGGAWGSW